jgi:DnaJ-class molecular chaperone
LSDPEKRKKYDQYGQDWKHADQFEKAKQQQAGKVLEVGVLGAIPILQVMILNFQIFSNRCLEVQERGEAGKIPGAGL